MALHGSVNVNGHPILSWEAVRVVELEPDEDGNTYNCTVYTDQGYRQFITKHRYEDGAAILAAKVLTNYTEGASHGDTTQRAAVEAR